MKKYLLLLLIILVACTPRLYEIKETQDIMGTFVTITVYHENKEYSKNAINDAFEEIRRIDSLLSSYKSTSEVSILNNNKKIINYSADLKSNLEKSLYYSKLSNGSFDITVKPVLDLYRESFKNTGKAPTNKEISEVLLDVDYNEVVIGDIISIGNNQKITLGGIAKGYAVDRAIEILESRGITNALVNAGGDMKAIGKKYASVNWNIALANPRNKDEFIAQIPISNKAIVTSGDYERYFNENKTFHHIVDPNTGYSALELMSVTITADNAFDADAISTSVFVLGKEKGLELIESLNNVEGLIIIKNKEIIKSSGFK